MKKNKVRIGMKCYESMRDVARAFGCSYQTILKRFKEEGQVKDNVLTLDNFELRHGAKAKKYGRVGCPVRCVTTGKEYSCISQAAKAIGVNNWTMSWKMEKAGKFIDNNGNEYVRLIPMKTNRDYPDTSANIIREHSIKSIKHHIPTVFVKENTSLEQALEVIKNEAIERIKEGSYQEATKYIEALTLMK